MKKITTINIQEELLKKIKKIAEKNRRSTNSQIIEILFEYVEKIESKQ